MITLLIIFNLYYNNIYKPYNRKQKKEIKASLIKDTLECSYYDFLDDSTLYLYYVIDRDMYEKHNPEIVYRRMYLGLLLQLKYNIIEIVYRIIFNERKEKYISNRTYLFLLKRTLIMYKKIFMIVMEWEVIKDTAKLELEAILKNLW